MSTPAVGNAWPSWFAPMVARPVGLDALEPLLRGDAPALLRGTFTAWPAVRRWDPEYLCARHGQREVQALVDLPTTGVSYPQAQERYLRSMRLEAFLEHMLKTPPQRPCYLAYTRAAEVLPGSEGDLPFEAVMPRDGWGTDTRLWIGSGGTRSLLHSDLKPNLYVQLWGTKEVALVPFSESRRVYPFPDNLVNSQVDIDALDLQRFPAFRGCTATRTVLRPGDGLFIPRGCWHYFRALEPSISVNHWFGAALGASDYLRLLGRLGPRYWWATGRDFVRHGLLGGEQARTFFFSPPSTGSRLHALLRRGDFSGDTDPSGDEPTARQP